MFEVIAETMADGYEVTLSIDDSLEMRIARLVIVPTETDEEPYTFQLQEVDDEDKQFRKIMKDSQQLAMTRDDFDKSVGALRDRIEKGIFFHDN